jgi:hypothetical protein
MVVNLAFKLICPEYKNMDFLTVIFIIWAVKLLEYWPQKDK